MSITRVQIKNRKKKICEFFYKNLIFVFYLLATTAPKEIVPEPEFAEAIPNVTVSAGRDVSLPCVVDNLGTFRVSFKEFSKFHLKSIKAQQLE